MKKLVLARRFGFIACELGRDVFFHADDLCEGLEFDAALEQRDVEFEVFQTPRGPKAINVRSVRR